MCTTESNPYRNLKRRQRLSHSSPTFSLILTITTEKSSVLDQRSLVLLSWTFQETNKQKLNKQASKTDPRMMTHRKRDHRTQACQQLGIWSFSLGNLSMPFPWLLPSALSEEPKMGNICLLLHRTQWQAPGKLSFHLLHTHYRLWLEAKCVHLVVAIVKP
jgi:hypothetical protein